ncbi:hypothetical protein ACFWJ5_38610 [Streptomyces qaidamensis]|uniref:hypothetical protein n=1 Tax=Streptomyces qaidamensis TaxID=1783515 RepID=UPI0036474B08
MTTRRTLGSGPHDAHGIRASQADLIDALPGVCLPDLAQLRERGVLGTSPATAPRARRTLGAGGRTNDDPPGS